MMMIILDKKWCLVKTVVYTRKRCSLLRGLETPVVDPSLCLMGLNRVWRVKVL